MILILYECRVVLLRKQFAARFDAPFIDKYGEPDDGFRRRQPLFLCNTRLQNLLHLWGQLRIPSEVTLRRITSEEIFRENYF